MSTLLRTTIATIIKLRMACQHKYQCSNINFMIIGAFINVTDRNKISTIIKYSFSIIKRSQKLETLLTVNILLQ